jgi:hypothetical protein
MVGSQVLHVHVVAEQQVHDDQPLVVCWACVG